MSKKRIGSTKTGDRVRIVITDSKVDPKGQIGSAVVDKQVASDMDRLTPRRGRPLDPDFDQRLVALCNENDVVFGDNRETIRLGAQIFAERHGAAYELNSVRQRIKNIVRDSKKYAQD